MPSGWIIGRHGYFKVGQAVSFKYQDRDSHGKLILVGGHRRVAEETGVFHDVQKHHSTAKVTTVWFVTDAGEDRCIRLDDLVAVR